MNENVRRLSKDRILLYLALSVAAETIINIISEAAPAGLFSAASVIKLLFNIIQGAFPFICLLGIRSERGHRYASVLGGWYHFLFTATFVSIGLVSMIALLGLADPLYALSNGRIDEKAVAALRYCAVPLALTLLTLICIIVPALLLYRSIQYTLCNLSARLGSPVNTPEEQSRGPERIIIAQWVSTAVGTLAIAISINTVLRIAAELPDAMTGSIITDLLTPYKATLPVFSATTLAACLSLILSTAKNILLFILVRRFRIACELDGTPEPPEENAESTEARESADGPAAIEAPEEQPVKTEDRRE